MLPLIVMNDNNTFGVVPAYLLVVLSISSVSRYSIPSSSRTASIHLACKQRSCIFEREAQLKATYVDTLLNISTSRNT